ncbi:uncharacterized protein PGTG_10906 [Puccinia graminis f. sp. tritici CRL 75-36-700-3]|uniref:Uncharacterized protein n=1 Tax=Puccinia graminis f. sp. tritici (strain CRL 75-36-700-3 / race SCCL) TaxID=418459 RepID=E3KKC2_PUCGT|nr:uncharacterized protein PGTG_10906 [Puccinia graminis f. sp. tritici CRL 75-36-700-3]EFP84747.1 hypothetical protein PGTG_10906 [Puccinia graminis f. sp. tritici CRL 75-36-700-3]
MNSTMKLYMVLVAVLATTMTVGAGSGQEAPPDTTFGCERDYPNGYCVIEGIKDKDGRARLKQMLPANIADSKAPLKMNCNKKMFKGTTMWCCPEGSLQWYDKPKHLTDSDVEGICHERTPGGPPGSDGQ